MIDVPPILNSAMFLKMEQFLQRTIHKIPEKFLDEQIYLAAKHSADQVHSKPSAYKSMFIMEEYKRMGGKIDESKSKHGLRKWIDEDWRNLTPYSMGLTSLDNSPKCGQKHAKQGKIPSVCRPKKEMKNYSKTQIAKAVRIKERGETISWKTL